MEIKITLTEQQAQFLKTFAEKQHPGAEDNMMTADAIHVVETASKRYVPYHADLTDYFDEGTLQFTADDAHEVWYDSITEMVEEESEQKVIPYEEALATRTIFVTNEEHDVYDYETYAQAYGVTIHQIAWVTEEYVPAAYFFIRDEAKKYVEYQRHNLRKPRVFTHHLGYANKGDLPVFRDLLLQVGALVNEADKAVMV